MENIKKTFIVEKNRKKASSNFINKINSWWPKEYSRSQQKLREIRIDPEKDGLCSEFGPHDFRCDWGRVTLFDPGHRIVFL